MFDFLNITVTDIIDIILVAVLIFYLFRIMKNTSAMSIFLGILSIYVVWIIVTALNMELTSSLLGQVLGVGVIALIVLFQPEIRRFLFHVGSDYVSVGRGRRLVDQLLHRNQSGSEAEIKMLDELMDAVRHMSDSRTGALIVLLHTSSLSSIIDTGDTIDARINSRLIENLFFKNSPLHDGALVMNRERIIAARCTLPLTENQNLPPSYGMRHRAAIGVTEQTDAGVIVVSEETGGMSFVEKGELRNFNNLHELRAAVENSYRRRA